MSQSIVTNDLLESIQREQEGVKSGTTDNMTTGRVIDVRKAVWKAIAEEMRQEYKDIFYNPGSFNMSKYVLDFGGNSTVRRASLTWEKGIIDVVCKELRCPSTTVEMDEDPFPDPYRVRYLPYKPSESYVWLIAGAEIRPRASHLVQTQTQQHSATYWIYYA